MSGFTEKRASWASERPGQNDVVLTWDTCHSMLSLVGRIVADVVSLRQTLTRIQPECTQLDSRRHTLDWAGRSRRYQLQEEIRRLEEERRKTFAELESLGVVVLEEANGLVGFPTIVNNRRAFFSWQPGEEGPSFWNYAGDTLRRKVPISWTAPVEEKPAKGKRKPRK